MKTRKKNTVVESSPIHYAKSTIRDVRKAVERARCMLSYGWIYDESKSWEWNSALEMELILILDSE